MLEQVTSFDARAGLFFGGVEGMIHDLSSEIIHGSFYGYALFGSLHSGGREMAENLSAHHETVFFAATLSIAALSRVLGKIFDMQNSMSDIEQSCVSALLPYVPDDVAVQMRNLNTE
ncbi:hypothetical protein LAZ40_03400 [Cereibacter sphaeroides]|uniref:hypothetical protein n=1 Tax=Cereibacter sphaeroides TaxID=1063 RepID=UPI001F3832D3|nr:hypothetical protein [Cereibacter sphaeroides]MCE6958102.1 hypothetical protein [Cereibacter sphaeroides]MCE6971189.1 hypothetical protein [Cereibacter sphaeroides]